MKKGEALFLLVQSLSQSEKKAVRIALDSPHGRKGVSMARLFDRLQDMPVYREKDLKEGFREDAAGNLPSLKTRLFDLILNSLLVRKSGRSTMARIQDAMQAAEVLHRRGLRGQSLERMARGQRLAEEFGRWEDAAGLLKRRIKLISQWGPGEREPILKRLFGDLERLTEYAYRQNKWFLLHEKYRSLARRYPRISPEQTPPEYRELQAEMRSLPPPAEEDLVATSIARNVEGMDHILRGEFERANAIYQELLPRWHRQTERIADQPELYLAIFNHYCGTTIYCGRFFEDHLALLAELGRFGELPKGIRLDYQRVHYFQTLYFYSNFGVDPEKVQEFIRELAIWLERNRTALGASRVLAYYSNILSYQFTTGRFAEAQRWVGKIRAFPDRNERWDIRQFSRLVDWVIRLERGEDLLERLQRPLSEMGFQAGHQKRLAESLRGVLRVLNERRDNASGRQAIREFHEVLMEIDRQPGRNPVGFAEFTLWVESLLRGIPLASRFAEEQRTNVQRTNLPQPLDLG